MKIALMLVGMWLLTGCAKNDPFLVQGPSLDEQEQSAIIEELKTQKYIERATVVFIDDDVLVATQIKPHLKWKKDKLEKKLQKKYEKLYEDRKVLVSTDYKIYYEANKLLEQEKSEEKMEKELISLKKLAKEET